MSHNWKYDQEERYCIQCKLKEYWNADEKRWTWISTEEFMNCEIDCERKDINCCDTCKNELVACCCTTILTAEDGTVWKNRFTGKEFVLKCEWIEKEKLCNK